MPIKIKRNDNNWKSKSNQYINMRIDIRTFDIFCKYVISNSAYLRINHLTNLNKLMGYVSVKMYENNPDIVKRIRFINKALEARLVYNLNDTNMIIEHATSGLDFEVDFIDYTNLQMNTDEILWCHKMISESLQYYFVYEAADNLIDLCTEVKSSDYEHRGDVISKLEKEVDDLKNKFRQSKSNDNLTDITFSLRSGQFESAVKETYNEVTSPSRRLRCGMQGLNQMIGGGFESGRVYLFLGLASAGKSLTLLNLAYQLKIYNNMYRCKDPTKTPCIVLLTMENGVVETITRLFDMINPTDDPSGMENYTVDEVIKRLKEEGQLVINDQSPIDIVIKYKANRSVDSSYLYEMCDNLADDGYEVICVLQDHIKRIRSIYGQSDIRLELGDVVNEFKTFALQRDIPIITAGHLNRDASKVIEDAQQKKVQTDVTMKLGKSNTGESFLMIDNSDFAIIVNPDFDEKNEKFMAFNTVKHRDKVQRTYIVQPFKYGSSIRLAEDVGQVPVFLDALHIAKDMGSRNPNIKTSSSNVMNSEDDDAGIDEIDSNNSTFALSSDKENYAFNEKNINSLIAPVPPVDEVIEETPVDAIANSPVSVERKIIHPIYFIKENKEEKINMTNVINLKEQLQQEHKIQQV